MTEQETTDKPQDEQVGIELGLKGLYGILGRRYHFEAVNQSVATGQIRFMGRVADTAVADWLVAVHRMLQAEKTHDWGIDISRKYFLRNDKLFYGWRVIFKAENLPDALAELITVADQAPKAVTTVEEGLLVGSGSHRRGINARGRGAQNPLTAVTGATALAKLATLGG